jgi:hypothetical protein
MPATPQSARDLTTLEGLKAWLTGAISDYRWQVRWILLDNGDRLPLPKEPALIAKLVEVTAIDHLRKKAYAVPGLKVDGDESGRMYPDMLLSGRALGHKFAALDVKVARRKALAPDASQRRRRADPIRVVESAITLGPYNSYFRWPTVRVPGALMAYGDITWHLDLIVIYDYIEGNVENVDPFVVETWRVASKVKSSGTRDYIGAVRRIEDLRNERGVFATQEEFYEFWRAMPVTRQPRWAPVADEPESVETEDLVEDT